MVLETVSIGRYDYGPAPVDPEVEVLEVIEPEEVLLGSTLYATLTMETTLETEGILTVGSIEVLNDQECIREILMHIIHHTIAETVFDEPVPAGEVLMGYDGRLISYTFDLTPLFVESGQEEMAFDAEGYWGPHPHNLHSMLFRLVFSYNDAGDIDGIIFENFDPAISHWAEIGYYILINEYDDKGRLVVQETSLNRSLWPRFPVYRAETEYCEEKTRTIFHIPHPPLDGPDAPVLWIPKTIYEYVRDEAGRLLTRTMSLLMGGGHFSPCGSPCLDDAMPVARTTNVFEDGVRVMTIMEDAMLIRPEVETLIYEPEIVWIPIHALTFTYSELSGKLIKIDFNNVEEYDEETFEIIEMLALGFAELGWIEVEMPAEVAEVLDGIDILMALDTGYDYFVAGIPMTTCLLLWHVGGPF